MKKLLETTVSVELRYVEYFNLKNYYFVAMS